MTKKEGADIVSKWMNKLTGDKAKIMNGDSFWALLGKEGGGDVADAWIDKLTGLKSKL